MNISAERRGDRRHAAADAGWQVAHCTGEAFADLLPRPINVGAIFKINRDVGQAYFEVERNRR